MERQVQCRSMPPRVIHSVIQHNITIVSVLIALQNQHRELETAVVVESQSRQPTNTSLKSSSSDISGPSDDEGGEDRCAFVYHPF